MAFTNRVRLPFKLHKPQFPEERDVYRKANGVTVTLSAIVRKVYEGITDELPEKLHERLKIALVHDNVVVEGDKYVGLITQEGDYQIEWSEFLSRPIAQAKFKAEVTPFNATNSNCGTCEEYSQIVAVNDDLGDLDEDNFYTFEPLANDDICCFPVTITIITYDSTYIDSLVINPDNSITFHIPANVPDINGVVLMTYRAECDNGMYDEANVTANVDGTDPTPVCLAPTNLILVSVESDTSAIFAWNDPSPAPGCDYSWEVRNFIGSVIASGDTPTSSVLVTGLPSDADFLRFFVRSNCCDGFYSNYVGPVIFSLPPPSDTDTCGEYELYNENLFFFRTATYIDCNGEEQTQIVTSNNTISICALQTSPGVPVQIDTNSSELHVTYIGLC